MRRLLGLALAIGLGACASPQPSPAGQTDASGARHPTASGAITEDSGPIASRAPSPTPTPSLAAGRPYGADEILAAMRDSRRPGGVPDELETEQIAAGIADQLWTWSGEPWASISIGGSCGPARCSLDVAGTPAGAAVEDLYQLEVAGGVVTLVGSQLGGYSPSLEPELDAIARSRIGDRLEGLILQSARWLPPPDLGRFVLAYRSGGEERSPALDVTVDLRTGEVVEAG